MNIPDRPGLARGPAVNSRRAVIRKLIAAGEINVPSLLEGDIDDALEQEALEMRVQDLVLAVPGVGDAILASVLNGRVPSSKTRLGQLTTRSRRGIADSLRSHLRGDD